MLMQDDNSLDIADILIDWIGKHVTTVQWVTRLPSKMGLRAVMLSCPGAILEAGFYGLEMPAISALSNPSGSVICGAWPNSANSTSLAPGMAFAAAFPNSG
jgi:hypothetical protein